MGFLKNLGVSLLSLILFLTLSIFSVAYMLNGTVLSTDFVTEQVDKIPIAEIVPDLADELITSELSQQSAFLEGLAIYLVGQQEPWLKQEIKAAVNDGYDYFKGETDVLSITFHLSELKTDLRNTLWQDTIDYLKSELEGKNDNQVSLYLQDVISQIPRDILPQELAALPENLREQAIEQYLRELTDQPTIIGLPPEITAPIENSVEVYFNRFLDDFIQEIPDSYNINEAELGADTMDNLETVRTIIGYFQTYYPWTIVLMVVLAGLIFLISFNIRKTARALGTNLCIFGVLDLVGVILVRSLPIMDWVSNIISRDIPSSLTSWIEGLSSDISSIALPLSIILLVIGVVLLVVSFLFKSKAAQETGE